MSEEFILQASESFRRHVGTIIEKKKKKKIWAYKLDLLFCVYVLILS